MFPLDEYGLFVFLINDDWKSLIFPQLNIGILIPLYLILYFYRSFKRRRFTLKLAETAAT